MLTVALFALALAQAAPEAPSAKPAPSGPTVVLETSLGSITVVLNKDKAPVTVNNFLKYVRSGYYNGTIFHRVIPRFMIQGGGMDANLVDKPGASAPIKNEAANGLRNSRGTLAMARMTDPNSATSQFFINLKDNHALDFGIGGAGYAVFGEVVEGMDVVDKIAAVQTTSRKNFENVPIATVLIKAARELTPAAPAKP